MLQKKLVKPVLFMLLLALVIQTALVFVTTSKAATFTFGNTDEEAVAITGALHSTYVLGRWQAPYSGNITGLSVYGQGVTGTSVTVRGCVYDENTTNLPNTLLGSGDDVVCPCGASAWFSLTGLNVEVTEGNYYWFGVYIVSFDAATAFLIKYAATAGFSLVTYSGAPPAVMVGSATASREGSIYATLENNEVPSASTFSCSSTVLATNSTFNATWVAGGDLSLDSYIFSWDMSGSWENASAIAFTSSVSSYTTSLGYNASRAGETVYWRYYANNSVGNWAASVVQGFTLSLPASGYMLEGPYYEDGSAATTVTATVYYDDTSSEEYLLNATEGVQLYSLNPDYQPLFVTYNFTSSYNFTRVYYFSNTSETVQIYIPRLTDVVQQYGINVICLTGLTNAYAYTASNIGGVNTIIEKQPLDVINAMPFWLSMYRQYTFGVTSDQGSWSWNLPADSIGTKTFTITNDMVEDSYYFKNMTVTVTRVNGTAINVYYYDPDDITTSITTQIMHLSSGVWVVDYMQTDLGTNTQNFTMYNATATVSYVANITAVRSSGTRVYQLTADKPVSDMFWSGAFDMFGVFPIPSYQLPAIIICLIIFGVGSWRDSDALAVIGIIVCGFLQVIGWGYFPTPAIAVTLMVIVFIHVHKGKVEALPLES